MKQRGSNLRLSREDCEVSCDDMSGDEVNPIDSGQYDIIVALPEDIQEWYDRHHTEKGLAQAFAAASNRFWYVEDNEYVFEEGTPEHSEACRISDAWGDLMEKLEEEIFGILRSEGVTIPEKGQIEVLVPFMERNGYYDGNGWWLPQKHSNKSTGDWLFE